jgi:O-antigen/teichoic acid export membrane protein
MTSRGDALGWQRLGREYAWNLAGIGVPAVAAVGAIGLAARVVSPDRFALVALVWSAVSWFGLLDLGLGRALALRVTDAIARDAIMELRPLIWTALWGTLALSLPVALLGVVGAPLIVQQWAEVPAGLHAEAIGTIRWLAIAFPLVTAGIVIRGAFEGGRRFAFVNAARVPMAFASYLLPVAALMVWPDARGAAMLICAVRGLYLLVQLRWLDHLGAAVRVPCGPDREAARSLVRIGGWIALSAICVPILVQGDRLVLPFVAPLVAFGWYAAVTETVMRIWMLTSVMQPVMLAALTTAQVQEPARLTALLRTAIHTTGAILLLPLLGIVLLRAQLLPAWLGPVYAVEVDGVVTIVAAGVFAGGFAQLTYAVLQAAGRGAPVAVTHLLQVPVVLGALVFVAPRWGVEGVAVVFAARLLIDALVLGFWSARTLPYAAAAGRAGAGWLAAGITALIVVDRLI